MTPERWKILESIFHDAAELAAEERPAYLEKVCGGDDELRREVELLLSKDAASATPLESIIGRQAAFFAGREAESDLTGKSLGPYTIIRKIGSGGMGTVYLAEDTRLLRPVALKLLPQSFSSDAERIRRFQLEAQAASAINHPNIITIHEVENTGSLYFIVSEYVEGKTLAERIEGKPLPLAEVLELAIQMAEGLAEAHRLGVIHRDIKPRNIMVNHRGIVKILDFGVAKVLESGRKKLKEQSTSTASGIVLGTVQYMSPEQAKGEDLDARSDLFSFGLVLYEMATGRRAFSGSSDLMILESILNRQPVSPLSLNSELPAELERIINKALEKDRNVRYQTAADLVADLKRLQRDLESGRLPAHRAGFLRGRRWLRNWKMLAAIGVLAAISVLTGILFIRGAGRSKQIHSLAVLPFINASGNRDAEYLSDGITDTTINALSQLPQLKVMARGSVFTFKGKDVDPREAGHKLNVDAVVTGRVMQRGDTLVIRAELMNVKDGSQLWGAEYDREFSDILLTQREIAQEISRKLSTRLSGEDEERLRKVHTRNTEAYRLCLLAEYYAHKENQESTRKSVEYYLQAIRLDPNYAVAYAGLANSYMYFPSIELASFRDVGAKALDAATKALALDDSLAQPHVALGGYYRNKGEFENAAREYKRAIALDPNFAEAHVYLAFVYSLLGRHQEALLESERALDLDPLWVSNYAFDGLVLTAAGHYQRALEQLQRAKEMDPGYCVTYVNLGELYRQQGKLQEAIRELKKPEAQSTGCSGTWGMSELAYTYALSGNKVEAEKLLAEILDYSKEKFVTTNYIAVIYLGLGDKDRALYWLEKGYRDESYWTGDMLLYLPILRADPKFKDYLRRINLL